MSAAKPDADDEVRRLLITTGCADLATRDDPQELPPYDDESFWAGRTMSGGALADLLASKELPLHRHGVTLVGVRIAGGLPLEYLDLAMPFTLLRCQLGDGLAVLLGARLRFVRFVGVHCGGLVGDGAKLDGGLWLSGGFVATGEVRLPGSHIAGSLTCEGLFQGSNGRALTLDRSHIEGTAFLSQGFRASGEVRVASASINGDLECTASEMHNPKGNALFADKVSVDGTVFLNNGFSAQGEVRLLGARATLLDACGGTFSNERGRAFSGDRIRISDGAYFREAMFHGEVRLLGAAVGGNLSLSGTSITNPGATAFVADGATVGGSLSLSSGFHSDGEVRFVGAAVEGSVDCTAGSFVNGEGIALCAEGARISSRLYLGGGFRAEGLVSMYGTVVDTYVDAEESWPDKIELGSFSYRQILSAGQTWKQRDRWLRRTPNATPDAYLQAAAAFRSSGDEHGARKLLMARHNVMLRPPHAWKKESAHGVMRHTARLWRRILRYTIGHGYEPWRVLAALVPLTMAMAMWYSAAIDTNRFTATDGSSRLSSQCTRSYPCPHGVVYALDTLVPVIDLGQRDRWVPDQSLDYGDWHENGRILAIASWVMSVAGWVIATLVAAGFTHAIRRE